MERGSYALTLPVGGDGEGPGGTQGEPLELVVEADEDRVPVGHGPEQLPVERRRRRGAAVQQQLQGERCVSLLGRFRHTSKRETACASACCELARSTFCRTSAEGTSGATAR